MALHLNFYHEVQKDAQVRARDPIKLAGFAAAGVALLMLGYYFYRSNEVGAIVGAYNAQNAEWTRISPQFKQTAAKQKELLALQAKNTQLVERLDGRLYWAPLLQLIAEQTPEVIQIIEMEGSSDSLGNTLVISGISAGEQPRLVAEQFRAGLQKQMDQHYDDVRVSFDGNSLEETGSHVEFKGKKLDLARFGIRVVFQQKPVVKTEETPAQEPKEGAKK